MPPSPDVRSLRAALDKVMLDLAQQVVKDGEGISKFVTIEVRGAVDDPAARRTALAVANSPLVKTAIAGEDATGAASSWRWESPESTSRPSDWRSP